MGWKKTAGMWILLTYHTRKLGINKENISVDLRDVTTPVLARAEAFFCLKSVKSAHAFGRQF